MTNFLSTAMLSAGAACFGSIIEIEKNMSQAEINTLKASEKMMDVQPLMLTALQNSFNAQADDQLYAGLIEGGGAMAAGAFQFGLTKMGESAGDEAYKADIGPKEAKITSELKEPTLESGSQKATLDAQLNNVSEERPVANDSTNAPIKDVEKEVAVKGNQQKTDDEIKEEKKAKKKDDRIREQKRQTAIQTYQSYAQLAGNSLNGAAKAGASYYNADGIRKSGSASAMNTVISGNQTAQSSNKDMVQTYKEAFTNASQILAGIVSAQRN